MHANIEQLLEMRDGAPVDSAAIRHVELCDSCSRQFKQLHRNRQALLDLPQLAPSPQVFALLSERLVSERRAYAPRRRAQPLQWAVAASVVAALALWMVPQSMDRQAIDKALTQVAQEARVASPVARTTPIVAAVDTVKRDELLQRSAALEAVAEQLALLGKAEPSSSADEALSALHTQLALVDYNLSAAQLDQYLPTELNALLTRRVSTLENIVGVQRAELASQGYHGFQVMTASSIEEDQTW